jgi:hypothetical protein
MFSSTPTTRRLVCLTAALAVAIGTPVAGAGVDRGIGVPPSQSQHAEPYSDALDRYLSNHRPVEPLRARRAEPYSDALDRYLRGNRPLETGPDALARFLANDLRSGKAATRPQPRSVRGAETRADAGIADTVVVVSAAAGIVLIGAAVATRRRRVALRNV